MKKVKKSIIRKILISLADKVNILIRSTINRPFQAISSDITEVYYNNGKNKAYLAVHKDVFGQMVYGYDLQSKMETKLVINSLKIAKKSIKKLNKHIPLKLICHQDQGSQYTSYDYTDKVLKSNFRISYSTPGTPTENPGQESFFGRLKEECRDEFFEANNFKELKKLINKRMKYYNHNRIHTSINYQTPLEFTKSFTKNLP